MTQHKQGAIGAGRALKFLVPIALVVFVADQLSKIWAENSLEIGAAGRPLIGNLIQFRLIYNPGAALSFGTDSTVLLTIVSALVAVGLIWVTPRLTSVGWVSIAGLLLGGTLGNLADRLFRAPGFPEGHVVDFIDYGPFIGNVADIAIVAAAVLICLLTLMGKSPLVEKSAVSESATISDDSVGSSKKPESVGEADSEAPVSQGSVEGAAESGSGDMVSEQADTISEQQEQGR